MVVEPDLILLQRFKESRDAAAFAEIVRRYAGAVHATCYRILHDPGSAEDAAQETFYRLMTRPHRVSASLGGWLHRAATRLALDIRRSDVARRRRESAYQPTPDADSWSEVVPILDEALAALPEPQQEMLVRHFLKGEAQADLAAEASTSAATMSRRIKAALEALRAEMQHRGITVAPATLLAVLSYHAHVATPAAFKVAMGKMMLYCTARSAGWCGTSKAACAAPAILRIPQMIYTMRWAAAAAAFCLAVSFAVWSGVRSVHWGAAANVRPSATVDSVQVSRLDEQAHNHAEPTRHLAGHH